METLAEGLWGLADYYEKRGEISKTIKCLEAICQNPTSFLPIIEVKTRLRLSTLLLKHSHNVNHAKSHLERSQLLLKSIPSCFELKFRAFSSLSQCYHLLGAISSQKQVLCKGLDLTRSIGDGFSAKLWYCNFSSQLSTALAIEGDYQNSLATLEQGYNCAAEICYPELQMFFATSIFHVHLMQWDDVNLVERSLVKCDEVWESFDSSKREQCLGLFFYNELLHIFYRFRICDYKNIPQHVDKLDAAMKADMHHSARTTSRHNSASVEHERRQSSDKLELAPYPIDGEWLPKSAVYALVDLTVIIFGRPKGQFKECAKRIQSGIQVIQVELAKLGITEGVTEVELQHSAIWMAGVYLMLLMQFLENKVAVDLTRAEFVEAQEALVQMRNWYIRFPTILQACESIIEMLRGQYAHSVGCFNEAAFHFIEAAKLTESKSVQAMCQVYAAVSYICIGDAESSSRALDLIGPVYSVMDSFIGVREKTNVLFSYGLLLTKQHNLQEARIRLATGLQLTH